MSLIVAIGSQNAFVLKNSLRKNHIFIICSLCFLCDVLLIGVGVLGLGAILAMNQTLSAILALCGAMFLAVYGLLSFKNALLSDHSLQVEASQHQTSAKTAILTTLAVTLLNPHVYIDTVVIIGGIAGTMSLMEKWQFLAGALLVSFVWFFGIGYGARVLTPVFAKPLAWKILEAMIGLVMWWIAFGLLKSAWVLWQ